MFNENVQNEVDIIYSEEEMQQQVENSGKEDKDMEKEDMDRDSDQLIEDTSDDVKNMVVNDSLSDDDETSSSDTPMPNIQKNNYNLNFENKKYLVTFNNDHIGFCNSLAEARSKMWSIARLEKHKLTEYNTYICQEMMNEDEIKVVGFHKFFIISYEKLVATIKIKEVYEFL
jgi:hypothetical protein